MNTITEKKTFALNEDSLPSYDSVLLRLLEVFQDDQVDVDEVIDLVSRDPGLVFEILKKINSSYYSLTEKIADIFEAVMHLGIYEVYSITNTLLARKAFATLGASNELNIRWFWRHSVSSAVIAEYICGGDMCMKPSAYSAALLHDAGLPVLISSVPGKARLRVQSRFESEVLRIEEESQLYGASHDEVGAQLLTHWGFPSTIIEAIRCHHSSLAGQHPLDLIRLHATVRVANCMAHYLYKPELGFDFVLDRCENDIQNLDVDLEYVSRKIIGSRELVERIEMLV